MREELESLIGNKYADIYIKYKNSDDRKLKTIIKIIERKLNKNDKWRVDMQL